MLRYAGWLKKKYVTKKKGGDATAYTQKCPLDFIIFFYGFSRDLGWNTSVCSVWPPRSVRAVRSVVHLLSTLCVKHPCWAIISVVAYASFMCTCPAECGSISK